MRHGPCGRSRRPTRRARRSCSRRWERLQPTDERDVQRAPRWGGSSTTATLTDSGPLVALIDAAEPDHERCAAALPMIGRPMLTTWPALTEAMHLLAVKVGWPGQETLWEFISRGQLEIAEVTSSSRDRARALMRKYRDTPMALADATLVALAEERRMRRIFTLDDDFTIYRLTGKRRFEIIP